MDPRQLRQALGQFPTGVCIVTASVDEEAVGMTISSFNTLSLDPPLVLFSIDRRAKSLPLWEKAGGYAINVLSEKQRDLSNRFARSLGDKWSGTRFERGYGDAPVFHGVAAAFECKPFAIHEGGDHLLFIAAVQRFRHDPDRAPLVFSQGRYATLKSTETAAPLWPLDIHY
ncbi:flavin reductase family protein [Pseudohoeflea sp. DP4N28-3]|uniref:Flavin reductase family protein n=1 Tax=Pseudohoeflea coraliihabitans TaxID=2860393 RepID=A0ABS6WQA8_9HYPH|nr:flavin reductase family protein [Pseudohoeflea sp. DP4N28-3]